MKSEKSSPAEKVAALKSLRSQVLKAKAELTSAEASAHESKVRLKKAKKAHKQAKKAAKQSRKNLKSLLAALAAARPARPKRQRTRVKKLVPRNASVIATLPPEPTAVPAEAPPAAPDLPAAPTDNPS